jgi:hypothetical protein
MVYKEINAPTAGPNAQIIVIEKPIMEFWPDIIPNLLQTIITPKHNHDHKNVITKNLKGKFFSINAPLLYNT